MRAAAILGTRRRRSKRSIWRKSWAKSMPPKPRPIWALASPALRPRRVKISSNGRHKAPKTPNSVRLAWRSRPRACRPQPFPAVPCRSWASRRRHHRPAVGKLHRRCSAPARHPPTRPRGTSRPRCPAPAALAVSRQPLPGTPPRRRPVRVAPAVSRPRIGISSSRPQERPDRAAKHPPGTTIHKMPRVVPRARLVARIGIRASLRRVLAAHRRGVPRPGTISRRPGAALAIRSSSPASRQRPLAAGPSAQAAVPRRSVPRRSAIP